MENYSIMGVYPDESKLYAEVKVSWDLDAIAIAQGLLKVTTIRYIAVYDMRDSRCVFHDSL